MKVIIAHPGKQHAYKLINALSELEIHEVVFCTSIAFQTTSNDIIRHFFSKRVIDNKNIQIKTFPILELLRIIGKKILPEIMVQYYFERVFDLISSKWLKKQNFDTFIGYECSSYLCLKICKEKKKTGILDLAQVHYKELERLGKIYDCLNYLVKGHTRTKINHIKEKEYKLAKYIFSISSYVKESLITNNISIEKIFDLPIGNKISTIQYEKKDNKIFQILYVGTIRDQKGVKLLIKAIDEINKSNIALKLIGQINEQHYYDLINSRPYITHLPYIANNQLNEHYQQSDVFILPSYLDSWGMVVIEAMSNNLPVIITENCGAKDAVKKGGGIIIKTGDMLEIKNAIEIYYTNEDKRKYDSLKANIIAKEYDHSCYKKRLSDILTNLK